MFAQKTMPAPIKTRIKRSVQASSKTVFLRQDFAGFGEYRQVSRALCQLEADKVIKRAGYGVYTKQVDLAIEDTIRAVKARLGKRVKRRVTIGEVSVLIGYHEDPAKNAQTILDGKKLQSAQHIVSRFDLQTIRRQSLQNLARWKSNDVWCSAYAEWEQLCAAGSDEQLIAAMTGIDQRANRLRQSPPYVGLIERSQADARPI